MKKINKKTKTSKTKWASRIRRMMEAKVELAHNEAILRCKLRGEFPWELSNNMIPIWTTLHTNESNSYKVDLFRVFHKGRLISELLIGDDTKVVEITRTRPAVSKTEIKGYWVYICLFNKDRLFEPLVLKYTDELGRDISAFDIDKFATWAIQSIPQEQLMEFLDGVLDQIFIQVFKNKI